MQRMIVRLGTVIVMGVLGQAVAAQNSEEAVPLDKVPKPILEAVKVRFKDAVLTEAAKETENGKTVYEVTIKDKGQIIDVTLTPAGEIIMIEKTISAKALPKTVTTALENKYPKATFKIVEEIFKVAGKQEKLAYFEVLLTTTDKKAYEVQLAPDGKILLVEDKSKEKP